MGEMVIINMSVFQFNFEFNKGGNDILIIFCPLWQVLYLEHRFIGLIINI